LALDVASPLVLSVVLLVILFHCVGRCITVYKNMCEKILS